MAALPSPTQVAGSHSAIYEAYYNQVDPNGYGRIGAMEAARFLKKSQLSDVILSRIWDLADPQSRGSLDKAGLFVALKLCALAQAGQDLNMGNLSMELPPPKMGEIPKIPQKPNVPPPPVISSISSGDWSIKPSERVKYDDLFDSLQPANGYIPGTKVKGLLMDSKLPLDTLGKIWDLADMDKDGRLDRHEFVVAMHLVYKALEKHAIPSVLPPELMPPAKRKESLIAVSTSPVPPPNAVIGPPPPIPPLPNVSAVRTLSGLETMKPPIVQPVQWVVSAEDKAAADKFFAQADMDMDGFVSGPEIKDIFLQSGLRQNVLAHIWSLCDICQSGKLNKEQFALSMYLITQKLRGIDPPESLTPEMIPPSLRKGSEGVVQDNNNISGYSNPELDMISKDIADLSRERRSMEQDIAQKEADIKIKNGEIKSLQSELDTLAATLKQLENQKGEAQKRLNDLKAQRAEVDRELNEVKQEICEKQEKVDKLRQQTEEQESVLRVREEELNSKRQELEGLRQEEQELEQQQNKCRDQLNELTKNLQDSQLQISQAKVKITLWEEKKRQMSDAISLYDSALAAGDASLVPDSTLQLNPEIEQLESETMENETNVNGIRDDAKDEFANANGSGSIDGFGEQDPFASNNAKEAFGNGNSDPFGSSFPAEPVTGGFTSDPFAANNNTNVVKQDPFDPFGDGKRTDNKSPATVSAKDAFGDDPFANLHAPTRPESPSPALPPKKAKQPPPRPAPPRPSQGPSGPLRAAPAPPTPSPIPDPFANANSDPFAAQSIMDNNNSNTFSSTGGFADFANFDSKPEPIPSRTTAVPTRPVSRPRATATATAATTVTPFGATAPKLADFAEDPFKNYQYEDPFKISDPFAEEDEINKNNVKDPFGFNDSTTQKQFYDRVFESDFNTKKDDKNNFDADFGKAFSDDNKNTKMFDDDFAKTVDINEAFATKFAKSDKKTDVEHAFRNISLNDKKNKNDLGKAWNGNSALYNLDEEQQLAWAAQESLKAEEERVRRIKKKEEEDLRRAMELSKREKSGKLS